MRNLSRISLVTVFALVGLFFAAAVFSQPATASATWTFVSGYDPHGGYIDSLVWEVYPSEDVAQAILALQSGDVDGFDERVPKDSLNALLRTPGVQVKVILGTIYRQFTLNCENFPTNITGFRRALAFSLDKYKVAEESTGGFAVPMDGAIPIPIGLYTYEEEMTSHFYDKDIVSANASLEAAGFKDLDNDGWREYDTNGNDAWDAGVDVDDTDLAMEMMASAGYDPAIKAVLVQIEGMEECGLHGTLLEVNFDALIDRLESGNFNLGCFSWNINPPGEPDLLYDFFRTGAGENEFFYRFHNSTFDAAADAMMAATNYEDAKQAAWDASAILIEQMPMVTCYNDAYIHAYRVDDWDGYVEMDGLGVMGNNYYTLHQVHLKPESGGPFGGEYRCVLSEGMDTTNIIMSDSGYTAEVHGCIYSTLWQIDPTGWAKQPDLAWNWTVEQTTAGGGLQDGAKYTFKLYPNASWSDGTPVTAADVEYSLETIWPEGPYDFDLVENVYRVDAVDDLTVEVYTNSSGWFEFGRATALSILPKHIWEPHEGDFTTWVPNSVADMTGSGCFKWKERVSGEYVALDINPLWHFAIPRTTTTTMPIDMNTLLLFGGIGVAVIVIVIIAGVYYFRIRK